MSNWFKKIEENKINLIGEGLNVRNDCQSGMWKLMTAPLTNKPIEIIVLEIVPLEGNFYEDAEPILWNQIWFVASPKEKNVPQDVVCYTLVKTESLANFVEAMVLAQIKYDSIYDFVTIAKFEPRSCDTPDKKKQNYYALTFEIRDRKEEEMKQVEAIKEFLKDKPKFVNQAVIDRFEQTKQMYAQLMPEQEQKLLSA